MSYNITVGQQIRSKRSERSKKDDKDMWKNRIEQEVLKPILDSVEKDTKFIIDAISDNPNKKVKIYDFKYEYKFNRPKDKPFTLVDEFESYKFVDGSISEEDFYKFMPQYYFREGFFKGMLIKLEREYPYTSTLNYYNVYVLADKEYYSEKDIKSSCIIC